MEEKKDQRVVAVMLFTVLDLYTGDELAYAGPRDVLLTCPYPSATGEVQRIREHGETLSFRLGKFFLQLDRENLDGRQEWMVPPTDTLRLDGSMLLVKICADEHEAARWAEARWREAFPSELEEQFWAMAEGRLPIGYRPGVSEEDDLRAELDRLLGLLEELGPLANFDED